MSVSTRLTAVSAVVLGLLAIAPAATAHEFKAGSVEIGHPWSRATPPGAKVGAGYLTLTNEGSTPDRLLSASSPASPRVEVHQAVVKDGVMTMREVEGGLEIAAGETVAFKPGSYHLMLMDLKAPLNAGDKVPLTLTFEKGGTADVYLQVEKMTAAHSKDGEGH